VLAIIEIRKPSTAGCTSPPVGVTGARLASDQYVQRRFAVTLLVVTCVLPARVVAENGRDRFVRSWGGRPVTVVQTLYTLIYNERGKLGTTHSGRRDGLTVLTPSNGVYFQFDGRQGKDDIVAPVPQRIMAAVSEAYGPETLDVRSYRKIEPVAVHQFTVGTQLVVGRIRFDRDVVKVGFVQPGDDVHDDPVTTVTIKWPLPLSNGFSEGDYVDALLRTYVEPKPLS
jgi:hypothetical protein